MIGRGFNEGFSIVDAECSDASLQEENIAELIQANSMVTVIFFLLSG